MGTSVKAIEMSLAGVPVNQVLEELNIRNRTQLKTWMKWYLNGKHHRLEQPDSSLKSETFYLDGVYRATNAHVTKSSKTY